MSQSIAYRIYRFICPKTRFTSGTADHPTPADLFHTMLETLVVKGKAGSDWVHFDALGSKPWVEVALEIDELLIQFMYKFEDDPIKQLARRGIDIPKHWELDHLLPKKSAAFVVPISDRPDVASMVDTIFQKSLGVPTKLSCESVFRMKSCRSDTAQHLSAEINQNGDHCVTTSDIV